MVPRTSIFYFSGSVRTEWQTRGRKLSLLLRTEHLTCFIGGMVGMASKIFDIKGDLEIAKKLTDGCVWAYGSMPSDIMAESAVLMPCGAWKSVPGTKPPIMSILIHRGRSEIGRLKSISV